MTTSTLFHLNNNIRLLRIAFTPLKEMPYRNPKMKRLHTEIVSDVKNPHFNKPLNQIEKTYA